MMITYYVLHMLGMQKYETKLHQNICDQIEPYLNMLVVDETEFIGMFGKCLTTHYLISIFFNHSPILRSLNILCMRNKLW